MILPEGWHIGMGGSDIDGGIGDIMIVKPFQGFFAGGATVVAIYFEQGCFLSVVGNIFFAARSASETLFPPHTVHTGR